MNTPPEKEETIDYKFEKLENIVDRYMELLTNKQPNTEPELEVRFGTKGHKIISKMDYDNVVRQLLCLGFKPKDTDGLNLLRIESEYVDANTGITKVSNIRTEIVGLNAIEEYCKTNNLRAMIESTSPYYDIGFVKKQRERDSEPVEFPDHNFRVSLSTEQTIKYRSEIIKQMVDKWGSTKKSFRYINRVSFVHPTKPFVFELSIVKSSSKNPSNGRIIRTYNIGESNVFNNPEGYEIEIEMQTDSANIGRVYGYIEEKVVTDIARDILNMAKIVMCGIQTSNYPIGLKEQRRIMNYYMRLLHGDNPDPKYKYDPNVEITYLHPNNFLGPQSVTLQLKNIAPNASDANIPNITKPFEYCVTEKADGERCLMIVGGMGDIYLMNSSMKIMFTGAKTSKEVCFNSILDGELILHNKEGEYINTYAAFDIYFLNRSDIRHKPFLSEDDNTKKEKIITCRLKALNEYIRQLEPTGVVKDKSEEASSDTRYAKYVISPIKIVAKSFYPYITNKKEKVERSETIFDACKFLLTKIKDNLFPYNTDGLIFTPNRLGVGSDVEGEAGPLSRVTWEYSFKWKPAEYNTIDFLITTKKDQNNEDFVGSLFGKGTDMSSESQIVQYKTLILRCGYDEKIHGYTNPCQDVIDDKLPDKQSKADAKDNYRPVQFYPTDPFDPKAGLCNIELKMDSNLKPQMFTEENQIFGDETIVEFRYDKDREEGFKWVPLRVRYDKTSEYKQGIKNYGNSYTVANNNWYSIHYPVTEEMLSTGKDIPSVYVSDDVYYNSMSKSNITKGLRDFHNLFVKKVLIQGVSHRGDTLIDYACGKAGDLPKWIAANLSFVFGIDIAADNLENRLNGACARYLNFRREFNNMPYALFVNGNSSLNIKSGQAMLSQKGKEITAAVFGLGGKGSMLGKGVERLYGRGSDGFNVSSCQFAIHYMFKEPNTFYNFMRNVAECTKLNGYFIGTCYDGQTIFDEFRRKRRSELEITERGKKVWKITKLYEENIFEPNDSSLGYKIDVYQESINQTLSEYLVNFAFLTRVMEDYGFVIISRQEAYQMGLQNGSSMFVELYELMMREINKNPNVESNYGEAPFMRDYEKDISFYNRYFIFKKVRTVDADKLTRGFLAKLPDEIMIEEKGTTAAQSVVKQAEAVKPKVKKLTKKLVLQAATEALEERPTIIEQPLAEETATIIEQPLAEEQTATIIQQPLAEEEVDIEIPLPKPKTKVKTTKKKATPVPTFVDIVDEE
jgi:mRNA capping enzyme/mRNA capping enzyme, catalytic domain